MDEDGVEKALGRLGLSGYEARVFIALQKLGSGSASEIADATDVPRSQVYGAAESLADRGVVEVQQSTPIRYRPLGPTEAEARLTAELEDERERAFAYLSEVEGSLSQDGEQRDEVWTVEGAETIDERVRTLAEDAEEWILYGTRYPSLIDDALRDTFRARAGSGVAVTVTSANESVLALLPDEVRGQSAPAHLDPGEQSTRVLVVDGEAVLLGVSTPGGGETAVWSEGTGFATVLARLVQGILGESLD
jgi:sugar-specific transcriptional regulator TrmB